MKFKFTLEKRRKDGELVVKNLPIRIAVNHSMKRLTLSTGYNVDLIAWNADKEKVKQGFTNRDGITYNVINSKLAEQHSFIERYSSECELQGVEINLSELKGKFAASFKRKRTIKLSETPEQLSLFDYFDMFVSERGKQNDWTLATFTKFKAVRKHLYTFNKKLTFDAINEDTLNSYIVFLRDKCNMMNSTLKKQLGYLKWFLNWANTKNLIDDSLYRNYKPKLKQAEKEVVYLTSQELDLIREYKIPESKEYLKRIRDVFLFGCYTSLRYSDIFNLKRSNVINNKLHIVTVKTHDKLNIQLTSKAKAILEKYVEVHFEYDKVLPVISNQKMNEYLKELCELAEIDTPITQVHFKGNQRIENTYPKYALMGTHTARRTFICNALLKGMPAHAVMKITGHSDYKSMQPYINIVGQEVDSMMDNLEF